MTNVIEIVMTLKWQWARHVTRITDGRWAKAVLEWSPREFLRQRGRPLRQRKRRYF